MGYYTPPAGLTPREILEGRIQFVQPGSIEDATIGGYPAVTFIDVNGAWPSRQAIVVVDQNRAYTVLAQPLDEARFPDCPALRGFGLGDGHRLAGILRSVAVISIMRG